jgi:hypothetical protein
MLWRDGVHEENIEPPQCKPRLRRVGAPSPTRLTALADTIAQRLCRQLARLGWLEGECESAFLFDCAGGDDAMDALRMNSIKCHIATGPQSGRKVATLQTLPGDAGPPDGDACREQSRRAGQVGGPSTLLRTGFSLHASAAAEAHERDQLEHL